MQASGSSSYGQHKRTRTRRRRRDNWRLDDRDLTDLGQERLDDYIQVFKCDQCTKPVLARYKDYHKREYIAQVGGRTKYGNPHTLAPTDGRTSPGAILVLTGLIVLGFFFLPCAQKIVTLSKLFKMGELRPASWILTRRSANEGSLMVSA